MNTYLELKKLLKDNELEAPTLLLNLDALDKNIQWLLDQTTKNIRLATKSIRSVEVLKYILDQSPRFQGLMCYSLKEALWLREQGFRDLLVAYPSFNKKWLKELAKNPNDITIMIDSSAHLELLPQSKINVAIDLDMSTNHFGLYFGVRRSPINSLEKLDQLLQEIKNYQSLEVTAVMGYEAQIAGVTDLNQPVVRALKKFSSQKFLTFRDNAVSLIKHYFPNVKCINGGGSGSIQLSDQDQSLTEITAGSLFYAPHLFDNYHHLVLTPALFYALEIVRLPAPNIYTCYSGGFIASGAVGANKWPQIYLPKNAQLLRHEGTGEVQTPIHIDHARLEIGDPVFLRHAKAGEICERFNQITAFRQQSIIQTFTTYRGNGVNFS
jgi:D-serine deaminase-like pyridoxal phosphate-dependent protein